MAAKNIKGITIELDGNSTKLESALKDVNSASRNLQSELREVDRLLKFDPKNTDLLAQRQKILADSVDQTRKRLDTLKEAERQVAEQFARGEVGEEQYRAIQREVAKAEQDLKSLEGQLTKVNSKWDDAAKKMGAFGEKTDAAGRKLAPLSAAAGGAVAGMVGLGVKAGQTADELNTLSKQTGISVEDLQKFQYAAEIIDVPMETFSGSLARLTRSMGNAQKGSANTLAVFDELNVAWDDGTGKLRSNEETFYDLIDALGKVENETERDRMAMELFGRSAQDLNPLILGGADALREMGIAAEEKGLILSQGEIDSANEFNDALDALKGEGMASLLQLGAEIANALLPVMESLSDVIQGVLEWMRGLDEDTLRLIMTVLALVAGLAPLLIIVGKVATGISALMGLASSLGPVIAALTGPVGLVIAAIVAVIAIGVALYKNWDKIKEFAGNLAASLKETFGRIKTNIVNAFKGVLDGIKKIWSGITGFMKSLPGKMLQFGKDIINGLIRGITGMVGKVRDGVKNIAGTITGGFKRLLGINSPSKVFEEYGKYTGEGFVQGIDKTRKAVEGITADLGASALGGISGVRREEFSGVMRIQIEGSGAKDLPADGLNKLVSSVESALASRLRQDDRRIANRVSLATLRG